MKTLNNKGMILTNFLISIFFVLGIASLATNNNQKSETNAELIETEKFSIETEIEMDEYLVKTKKNNINQENTSSIKDVQAISKENVINPIANTISSEKNIDEKNKKNILKQEESQVTKDIKVEDKEKVIETSQSPTLYTVTEIIDGDTIKISMNENIETVRLIGINTPETVDPRKEVECFGYEATNHAKKLLQNKQVRIEYDDSQGAHGRFGRLLVYVFRDDGMFFNQKMIEDGYAYEYTYNKPYKYQSDFKSTQNKAQSLEKGLWSRNTCNGELENEKSSESEIKEIETNNNQNKIPDNSENTYNYYTSSWRTAKYYYPVKCRDWEDLNEKHLRGYPTLELLLNEYNRSISPQC